MVPGCLRTMMKRALAIVLALELCGAGSAAPVVIEVASIKPSEPAACGEYPNIENRNGRLDMTCVTLKLMIQIAYGVNEFQVAGGPEWLGSSRWNIAAKAANPVHDPAEEKDISTLTDQERKTNLEKLRAMVQALLTERFQLQTHRETKQLPMYSLTVARGGPKLKSNDNVASPDAGGLRPGRGYLAGTQVGMSFVVQTLSQIMGRPIEDRTGLKGKYDFELKWTPDQGSANSASGGALPPSQADAAATDPNATTIFTALQEQLGLKLDSGKAPVEVVVVDHVEKALAN
jgi:bla regulator protein blaR1